MNSAYKYHLCLYHPLAVPKEDQQKGSPNCEPNTALKADRPALSDLLSLCTALQLTPNSTQAAQERMPLVGLRQRVPVTPTSHLIRRLKHVLDMIGPYSTSLPTSKLYYETLSPVYTHLNSFLPTKQLPPNKGGTICRCSTTSPNLPCFSFWIIKGTPIIANFHQIILRKRSTICFLGEGAPQQCWRGGPAGGSGDGMQNLTETRHALRPVQLSPCPPHAFENMRQTLFSDPTNL